MSKKSKALKRRGVGTKLGPVVPNPWLKLKFQDIDYQIPKDRKRFTTIEERPDPRIK